MTGGNLDNIPNEDLGSINWRCLNDDSLERHNEIHDILKPMKKGDFLTYYDSRYHQYTILFLDSITDEGILRILNVSSEGTIHPPIFNWKGETKQYNTIKEVIDLVRKQEYSIE